MDTDMKEDESLILYLYDQLKELRDNYGDSELAVAVIDETIVEIESFIEGRGITWG